VGEGKGERVDNEVKEKLLFLLSPTTTGRHSYTKGEVMRPLDHVVHNPFIALTSYVGRNVGFNELIAMMGTELQQPQQSGSEECPFVVADE
jgi:hypothetical protein